MEPNELKEQTADQTAEIVRDLAVAASGVDIIPAPKDPRAYWLHNHATGDATLHTIDPPLANHAVDTIDTLATLAIQHGMRDAELWHGPDEVVLVMDGADRREFATMTLLKSGPWSAINAIDPARGATPEPFTQSALVRFLRLKLGQDPALILPFRRLDFGLSRAGKSEINHGKESIGRQIEAEVKGVDKLPETLTVDIPVYDNPGLEVPQAVRLAVDIDVAAERFYLVPLPGELAGAMARIQRQIHARILSLLEDGGPYNRVYEGTPRYTT